MSGDKKLTPPPVQWAQKKNQLLITFGLEDCKDPTLNIDAEKIYFKGVGGTDQKEHEVTINLYKEIDPEKTTKNARGRNIEIILMKKEEGPYWPRLTKENSKFHWLKIDFNKWRDEDDSDGSASDDGVRGGGGGDLESVMRNMGYLSGNGDMKPNLDDLPDTVDDEEVADDSDAEELPDLE
ncbi:prostaglandin E synthase 3 [Microplitis mediator]|uniref:prostaglandin E synthase 3 n=1 Tax=Microplitis mediator TaxID=375433 RepID=UPI0025549449|nr:prostaglandin E synthase 3 [Microplitis mediator]